MNDRFIIFALPRTGSSALAKALNLHKTITCFHEPFNPGNHNSSYRKDIDNEKDLFEEINKLQLEYTGIKHVWHPQGWPFPKNPLLNKLILSKFDKIIFLTRRNILQRVVSNQISSQTNIWSFTRREHKDTIANFQFDTLDKNSIRWYIRHETEYLQEWTNFLREKNIDFLELSYEDIFNMHDDLKIKRMNEISGFIGAPCFEEENIESLASLLGAENKMSTAAVYRKIPGIMEIETEFGNDASGWLFK